MIAPRPLPAEATPPDARSLDESVVESVCSPTFLCFFFFNNSSACMVQIPFGRFRNFPKPPNSGHWADDSRSTSVASTPAQLAGKAARFCPTERD